MDRDDKILDYVQGTMDAQDRTAFDAAIADDPDLAAQIAALTGLRGAMAPTGTPDMNAGWTSLCAAIDHETYTPANDNRPAFLSLVQVACIAIASVLTWQFVVAPMTGAPSEVYAPASGPDQGPELQVVFHDAASLGEVSDVLNALDGTIVSGPGSLGLYRISFVDKDALGAAMDALSARPDLVSEILSE